MTIVIHETKPNRFVVSEHDCWVEGIYDSREAAAKAVSVDPDQLHAAWQRALASADPVLSIEDLG